MTNRERISGVDTAWLRMEQPTNLMMIVGVMMFDGKVKASDVKRILEARFLAYRRFRSRAVQEPAGSWWEADESFDLDRHVERATLPGKAGKEELEALVSELASTPLETDRPLWHFHLVENYAGGSALVTRIHHCYADGIALIQVMLSLTHPTAEGSLKLTAGEVETAPREEGDFWERILRPVGDALGGGASRLGPAVQDAARKAMGFATEAARLATMGRDASTRFKGTLGERKRAAWADPLPLDDVKVVGKALGCSINDVLLSMASGALRDYLLEKGDAVDGLVIRAVVPVNLRPQGEAKDLGNRFGLVFLDLPLGMEHPLERLYEVRRRMLALKGSYQPVIALALLNAVGYGPKVLQDQVTALLSSSASAVMTNVPGPQQPLYFAGRRIVEQDFWVPQSGGIGMGVSILSYDGRIQFGVITDAGLVPDPERIVNRFSDEFAKLRRITPASPWGERAAAEAAPATAAEVSPAKTGARSPKRTKKSPPPAPSAEPRIPKRFRNL